MSRPKSATRTVQNFVLKSFYSLATRSVQNFVLKSFYLLATRTVQNFVLKSCYFVSHPHGANFVFQGEPNVLSSPRTTLLQEVYCGSPS